MKSFSILILVICAFVFGQPKIGQGRFDPSSPTNNSSTGIFQYYESLENANERTVGYMGNMLNAVAIQVTILLAFLVATWWRNNSFKTRLDQFQSKTEGIDGAISGLDKRLSELIVRVNSVPQTILDEVNSATDRTERNTSEKLEAATRALTDRLQMLEKRLEQTHQSQDLIKKLSMNRVVSVWHALSLTNPKDLNTLCYLIEALIDSELDSVLTSSLNKLRKGVEENVFDVNSPLWEATFESLKISRDLAPKKKSGDASLIQAISSLEQAILSRKVK